MGAITAELDNIKKYISNNKYVESSMTMGDELIVKFNKGHCKISMFHTGAVYYGWSDCILLNFIDSNIEGRFLIHFDEFIKHKNNWGGRETTPKFDDKEGWKFGKPLAEEFDNLYNSIDSMITFCCE